MQHTSCYRKVRAKSGCCPLRRKGHPVDVAEPWLAASLPLQYFSRFRDRVQTNSCGYMCMLCLSAYIVSSLVSSCIRFPSLLLPSLPFCPRPFSSLLSCLFSSLISSSLISSSLLFHSLLVPSLPFSSLSALASSLVPRPRHPFALVYSLSHLLSRPFPHIASDVCNQ